jgi:hypothetical protein
VESAIGSSGGFLPAETPEKTMDRLHAYCYFLEGLLPVAGRAECAAALVQGTERVAEYLRGVAPVFERSDVYAQLLRARLFAHQLAGAPLDPSEADLCVRRITEFQPEHTDPRIAGGYWFGRKGREMLPYVNPVSTAFCLQAVEMWSDFKAGRQLDRRSLI